LDEIGWKYVEIVKKVEKDKIGENRMTMVRI